MAEFASSLFARTDRQVVDHARDLRDTPLTTDTDLREVSDGAYVLVVELLDSARTLGTTSLRVVMRSRLTRARLLYDSRMIPSAADDSVGKTTSRSARSVSASASRSIGSSTAAKARYV